MIYLICFLIPLTKIAGRSARVKRNYAGGSFGALDAESVHLLGVVENKGIDYMRTI